MSLLTPAQVREHIDTDLLDPAIQRLLDDASAAIVERFGAHSGPLTEAVEGGGGLLFLSRPALSLTSLTEANGLTSTLLAANDWRSWYGGYAIERLNSGTNAAEIWGERTTVVYTPVPDTAIRTAVELELVRLAIRHEAVAAKSIGDWSETSLPYVEERERLLSQLRPAIGVA